MVSDMNRRELLRHASTGAAVWTAASYSRVLGANDRIRLGVVGCGGRGSYVMSVFQKNPVVDVAAVCDVWLTRADRAKQKAPGAAVFQDHRKLLDEAKPDALLVATPDHWHSRIAIDALNAGKDVYCEKPLTLRIEEGPQIVKAARVNKRVCQVGMQQRSGPHYMQARDEYIKAGKLGKITLARTWWHGNGAHLAKAPADMATKPENLDWSRFLAPVKWRDWDPQQFWNFRAYLDFGGGQITDLFTHWIDVVHMFMGQEVPISAVAGGGVYCYEDGRTAPDTINAILEYPGKWAATFEATLAPGLSGDGIEIVGTEGRLNITRAKFEFTPKGRNAQPTVVQAQGSLDQHHVDNFVDCMKTRNKPNGDVLIGHRAAQASHLANIAWVQKRRIKFDPEREEILPL
jgi:predicted dehydrogenase